MTPLGRSVALRLWRVVPGAFGRGRPDGPVVLGPAARLALGWEARNGPRMAPALRDMADGETVIAFVPVAGVTLHHVGVGWDAALRVGELGVMSARHAPTAASSDPGVPALFGALVPSESDGADPAFARGAERCAALT